MGHDEHGPAYPEPSMSLVHPYRCPICRGDEHRYSECEYPGCPDGRDRYHPHRQLIETYEGPASPSSVTRFLICVGLALAVVFWLMWPRPAPAMDHGFNPNDKTVRWMESLQRPNMPGSCCGKGDGYPVSDYWNNHDGTWTAVIGDGSGIKYPDGTTRNYIATGEKIIVPNELVNREEDDIDNPTDVSWIFMTVHAAEVGTVYCLIRHPSGN